MVEACCKNPLRDDDVLDQGGSKRREYRSGEVWLDCVCVLTVELTEIASRVDMEH